MKSLKNICVLLLFLVASLSAPAQRIVFEPSKPEGGKPISISYNPAGTNLGDKTDLSCRAQVFSNQKPKVTDVPLVKEGNVFKGTFTPAQGADLILLTFSSGVLSDDSPDGYYILMYEKGIVRPGAYLTEARLLSGMGRMFGMRANLAGAVKSYEKAFKTDPKLKGENVQGYYAVLYAFDKIKGEAEIKKEIKLLHQKEDEKSLMNLMDLNAILRNKEASDSVKTILTIRYPKGKIAYSAERSPIYKEKDPEVIAKKLDELVKKFGLNESNKEDAVKIADLYYPLVHLYATKFDKEKFEQYSAKIVNKVALSSLCNTLAWRWAEKKENGDFAAFLSKKSLDMLEEAKNNEVPDNYASREEYIKSLDQSYAGYADTYALILHNNGNDKEAVVYQKKALSAVDPEGNERYVIYLDLAGDKEEAFREADRLLRLGKGTPGMKTRFQALYEAKHSSIPFGTYIAGVDKEAEANEKAEWKKKMINIPAPGFELKNLKGETVRLASLKGKTVVVDYWATWCGPCVASFPGMQKAVTKYSDDPNVVFLFVNTWQREENREKVVTDFINEKKYTFNVLYDTKNKQDPNDFDVVSTYNVTGIPTKFIIGPEGNIRFKIVGSSGSADGIVREMDTMISLVALKENSK